MEKIVVTVTGPVGSGVTRISDAIRKESALWDALPKFSVVDASEANAKFKPGTSAAVQNAAIVARLQAQLEASEDKAKNNLDAMLKEQSRLGDVIKALERTLKDERDAHNVTRDVLHTTELELAKTRGYLDARRDAEPPVMVPLQREGALASYADGSRSVSAGWRNEGYGQTPNKPWWHR